MTHKLHLTDAPLQLAELQAAAVPRSEDQRELKMAARSNQDKRDLIQALERDAGAAVPLHA